MNLTYNHRRYTTIFFSFFIAMELCFSMTKPANELTKTFGKFFEVTEATIVDLEHHNGDIEIFQTDEIKGKVEVELIVRGDVKEDLQMILDKYELSIRTSGNTQRISSDTNIKSRYVVTTGWLFTKTKRGIEFDDGDEINSKVDDIICRMTVYIPKVKLLKVENKHNDIVLDHLDSDVELTLFDGNLESQDLTGSMTLNMKHGNADLGDFENGNFDIFDSTIKTGNVNDLKLEAKHSDLVFNKIESIDMTLFDSEIEFFDMEGDCNVDAKHSRIETNRIGNGQWEVFDTKVNIDVAENLTIKSKHGTFDIGKVNKLTLEQSFDNTFKIEEIQGLHSTNSKHSKIDVVEVYKEVEMTGCFDTDLSIRDLRQHFSSIEFEGKNSTMQLELHDPLPSHNISISIKHGKLIFDEANYDLSKHVDKNSQLEIEGHYGSASSENGQIKVRGSSIDARIDI